MVDTIKVRPNGAYMMQDPSTGEEIQAYGESEVTRSAWVEQQIANGKLLSDTKIDENDLKNPGSEPVSVKKSQDEDAEAARLAPQTNDEPARARAPQEGEKRGASQSKRPEDVNRVKTA